MKTYSNDNCEIFATDSYDRVQIGLHEKEQLDMRARYALDLAKVLSVAMMLDTHPSAKRATASEVATVAGDLSAALFADIKNRGWTIPVPSMEQIAAEARENRGRN